MSKNRKPITSVDQELNQVKCQRNNMENALMTAHKVSAQLPFTYIVSNQRTASTRMDLQQPFR